MDNYDKPTPWRARQARWSIPDLTLAIKLQCQACNQEERLLDSNDCVSSSCALYPFRPGSCRPEVDGVRRAARHSRPGPGNVANLRNTPSVRPLIRATGTETTSAAGERQQTLLVAPSTRDDVTP